MKTIVLEPMPELFWQELSRKGWAHFFSQDARSHGAEAEVVIIRTATRFSRQLFEQFPKLKLIIRAGSGFDNIDVAEAERRGVAVCNTPEANSFSAYEHTLAMILALIKRHQQGKEAVMDGSWRQTMASCWEISDLRVLVVGVGRVGTRVAKALEYLGAEVRGLDPYLTPEQWHQRGVSPIPYIEGVAWANCISYHCPLFDETLHYFNSATLSQLQQPIWLINVARGGVVDENAVAQGLNSGMILGAGFDVFEQEPWQPQSFSNDSRVILTPHTGAFTEKAKHRMALETVAVWQHFLKTGEVISPIEKKFGFR
jgi:D-3-phosphoglycerate dehydrogenase